MHLFLPLKISYYSTYTFWNNEKKIPTSEYHNCHVVVLLMGTSLFSCPSSFFSTILMLPLSLSISKSMPFLKINIRLFLNRSQLRYPLAAFVTNLIITLQFSDSALLILFCSTVISPVSFETIQQWLYACFKTKWSEFHSYNPERHLYLNEEHKCTVIILYFNNTVYLLSWKSKNM